LVNSDQRTASKKNSWLRRNIRLWVFSKGL